MAKLQMAYAKSLRAIGQSLETKSGSGLWILISLLVEIPFMARPLRIEYPGAYYHVSTRGNERKAIFQNEWDRKRLLELLTQAVEHFHLRLHGYVLMGNHYHLLVETPRGGLKSLARKAVLGSFEFRVSGFELDRTTRLSAAIG